MNSPALECISILMEEFALNAFRQLAAEFALESLGADMRGTLFVPALIIPAFEFLSRYIA